MGSGRTRPPYPNQLPGVAKTPFSEIRTQRPLRDVQGQARHMYLAMLAYSLLMGELKQGRAKEWALHRLMTIGEACRAMIRESLRTTLTWAIEQVTRFERPFDHVVTQLGLA